MKNVLKISKKTIGKTILKDLLPGTRRNIQKHNHALKEV